MKSNNKRESAYSPMRQVNSSSRNKTTSLDDSYPAAGVHSNNDYDPSAWRHHHSVEANIHEDPIPTPVQHSIGMHNDENDGSEQDPNNKVEEVYLCDCCGVTKEMSPAIKYMPLLRSLFILTNFLAFAFGFANFGMGLWFRIDPKVYEIHKYIETQNFTIAGWILLFGGFTACLVALLGFLAAFRQAPATLLFYCIMMTLLTLAFVGTLVLLTIYGFGTSLEMFLIKEIYEQMRRRSMSTELDLYANSDAAQFLDFVQVKMRCCGAYDFLDYSKLGMIVPTTCYAITKNFINAPGCGRAIRELFDIRAGMATGFTGGSVVSQLLSIVFASLMICSIYNARSNLKQQQAPVKQVVTVPSPSRRSYSPPGIRI